MLLETKVRELKAKVVFNEREKYDPNSPIDSDPNEKLKFSSS